MKKEHQLEVGNEIRINGRSYWISRVVGEDVELMPNPDNPKVGSKADSFWSIFFLIVLIIVLLKLVF